MNCPKCNSQMSGGAPHCETIKVQMECHNCGHYENEYYTTEEMAVNDLTANTGASLSDCREALEATNYNFGEAVKFLERKNQPAFVNTIEVFETTADTPEYMEKNNYTLLGKFTDEEDFRSTDWILDSTGGTIVATNNPDGFRVWERPQA